MKPGNVFEAVQFHLDFDTDRLDEPTQAMPGSPEKVDILFRRAQEGYALFHPQDRFVMYEHRIMMGIAREIS